MSPTNQQVSTRKRSIDFLLLTALQVERKALCSALQLSDKITVGTRTYWQGRLTLRGNKAYEIVVGECVIGRLKRGHLGAK